MEFAVSEVSSGYIDHRKDIKEENWNAYFKATIGPENQPKAAEWVENLPGVFAFMARGGGNNGAVSEPELDSWSFHSVAVKDSLSMRAEGRQKERIEQYREACERLRKP